MNLSDKIKLPKQWKHWCRKMHLRPIMSDTYYYHQKHWFYLKGNGFCWRVNCNWEFERGDTNEEFDRWALCNIDKVDYIPQTFEEFEYAVESLIAAYTPSRNL